ncbi:MFS transporter [Frankia sp. AgKG'84/4]|uniref:MFS transporter n=1 Tax=Frankia sp. AgKG'84/4 TaxID=573490 RepID=UPI00200D5024|nr:MFS transporter [Frankia sp. AgKG'84/4]MCL9793384.1 MFS transporter [Frankia sp. AgKG'84/4]
MSALEMEAAVGSDTRRQQITLAVLCSQLFLDSMDVSLAAVALPSIGKDLDLSAGALQWVISGYAVSYGGLLLLGGRLADVVGRRRMFNVATVAFVLANLLGGLVSVGWALIVARVLTGVAAAFIAPAALSILTTTFREGPERDRAMGVFSLTGASGYTAGLILSGLLTQVHWRLVFFVPATIALVVSVVSRIVVPPDHADHGERPSFDVSGAVSVTGGLLLVVFGLNRGGQEGWAQASTLTCLLVGAALLVVFTITQLRGADPLIPARVRTSARLVAANSIGLCWSAATIGWQFLGLLYLQQNLGYNALEAGLAIVPMGIAIFAAVQIAIRLIPKLGLHVLATVGLLFQAAGILLFIRTGDHSAYASVILPGLILQGLGNGLSFPAFNIAGVTGVENRDQGLATAMITASVQLGAGIGVAVLTAVLTAGDAVGDIATVSAYHPAFLVAGIFSLLGATIAVVRMRPATQPTVVPQQPAAETAQHSTAGG